jgi:hypothetical protein
VAWLLATGLETEISSSFWYSSSTILMAFYYEIMPPGLRMLSFEMTWPLRAIELRSPSESILCKFDALID